MKTTLRAAIVVSSLASAVWADDVNVKIEPRATAPASGGYYTPNRPPLQPVAFMKLPPGTIKPQGWLRHQLELDAKGLCGNLPEVSRFLNFENTGWVHPEKSGWEEVSYWLRGYAALGYALGDEKIMAETRKWVEAVMATQQEDGFFGPNGQKPVGDKLGDPWGHMPMFDVLRTYYEYTRDKRALDCLTRYFRWLDTQPVKYFKAGWAATRWADTINIVQWLYNVTGEKWVLDLAKKIYTNTVDYTGEKFPTTHNVNLAQGIRQPAQYWLQAAEAGLLQATDGNYRRIMDEYGQFPGGGFAGDEHMRPGCTDPRQGFETCGIVELMRTFEIMTRITGRSVWSDRVEELAFNTLPAALTPDHRGIHYITCANSPVLTHKGVSGQFDNKFTMLAYRHGAHDYRCCPHNYGMGWPNYAEEMWLATADQGLAASLYGASEVQANVGAKGTAVTVAQTTDYPFSDTIRLKVSTPENVSFPLHLRIPGWCDKAEVQINGKPVQAAATPLSYIVVNREWKNGDEVILRLPMDLSVRRWAKNGNSASVNYGPITFSLLIPEKWERGGGWIDSRSEPAKVTKSDGGTDAWPEYEVRPAGPWNYGLVLDESKPAAGLTLERRPGPLAENPFTHEGAPLLLKAKAKRIPGWTLDAEDVVTPLEPSPVRSGEPEETVTLVPMGAARLRISAFPVISTGPAAYPWGKAPKPPQASALPPISPLFDYPIRDTAITVGPDGTYYLTGTTGSPSWWTVNEGIRIWKSQDLKTWEPLGLVWSLEKDATWQIAKKGKCAIWAPELHYFKNTFWIAYCVNDTGISKGGGTGILRSKSGKAEGPYEDVKPDGPLTDKIDASLFCDDDGKVYFVWQNGMIARMKDDMSGLAEEPRLLKPANAKEVGFEGAFLTKINGRYHLVASVFGWKGLPGYHCTAASAESIYGPYGDAYLAIPHGGHNTLFKDARGQWYSTFFGNDAGAPFRERAAIVPIQMTPEGKIEVKR